MSNAYFVALALDACNYGCPTFNHKIGADGGSDAPHTKEVWKEFRAKVENLCLGSKHGKCNILFGESKVVDSAVDASVERNHDEEISELWRKTLWIACLTNKNYVQKYWEDVSDPELSTSFDKETNDMIIMRILSRGISADERLENPMYARIFDLLKNKASSR